MAFQGRALSYTGWAMGVSNAKRIALGAQQVYLCATKGGLLCITDSTAANGVGQGSALEPATADPMPSIPQG